MHPSWLVNTVVFCIHSKYGCHLCPSEAASLSPHESATNSHLSLLRLRLFSRLGNGFPGAAPAFPSFDLGTGVLGTGFGGPSPTFGGGPAGGTGVGGLTWPGGVLGGWDGWAGVEIGALGAGWCGGWCGLGLAATVLAGWGGCTGGWGPGLACGAFGGSAGGEGFATTCCALAGTTCGLAAGVCGLAGGACGGLGGCAGGWGLGGGLWGAWGLATTCGLPSNDLGVTGFGGGAGTVFGCTVFGPLAAGFFCDQSLVSDKRVQKILV